MRVLRYRQLLIPLFALVSLCVALIRAGTAAPATEFTNELQAAKLHQAALLAREASDDDWAKLDAIYVGLNQRYPKQPVLLQAHAEMLWGRGAHDRAERLWREALALNPRDAALHHQLGVCAITAGRIQEAAACYRRALAEAPDTALYHFDLANTLYLFRHDLLDARDPDAESVIMRSMEHYAAAARLAPTDAEYAKSYAETFYGLAKPDRTAEAKAWKHYIDISANKDFGYANLARTYLRDGKKAEARMALSHVTSAEFAPLKKRIAQRIENE